MAERAVGDLVAGRYEIRGLVGPRPLGTLYRAADRDIGVEVALRVLSPHLLPDDATRHAFVQKVGRAKALSHANLVRLYDVRAEGDEVVVVVQWAPGTALAEKVRTGRLSHADARRILGQVAAAMTHAHGYGIVLGDVRTENIVVAPTDGGDALKLSSVGIGPALPRARFLDALRGTLAFERLAPEIRNGMAAEVRADVYALAVLAVELTTGAPPSRPLSITGAASALMHVLTRALADDPMLRQATVESLHHELDAVLATGELPPRPRRPSPAPVDFNVEDTNAQTRESPLADPAEVGYTEETRQVDEQELDRLRGREVTRQAHEDEIWDLRVKSSDTQQIEMDMIEPADAERPHDEALDLEAVRAPDGTWRSPVPKSAKDPFEAKTDEVAALPPANEHTPKVALPIPPEARLPPIPATAKAPPPVENETTSQVPRVEPEMPPPPPALPVVAAPRASLPKPVIDADDGTPLPPPAPAPPMTATGHEDFGDDQMATNRIDKLSAAELGFPAPAPARGPAPPRVSSEPKIVSELPVESGQARQPPPLPPPPPRSKPAPARPARPTLQVQPVQPRPRSNLAAIALIVIACGVVGAIVLGVLSHMRDLRRQRDRIEKQRLAGELNAKAEAMRRSLEGARPDLLAPQPLDAGAPIVTHPEVTAAAAAGPCPLGSKLVDGKPRFCVDLYEYPGGKTIPRTGVSFEDATRLCASRGQRLCGETEWERACRGKGSASFPYGTAFDPSRCNTKGIGEVVPAGTFKDCRSAAGAYDMSGNVAEWVVGRDNRPACKGGSVQTTGRDARCSHTVRGVPREGDVWVGFRCCADPK